VIGLSGSIQTVIALRFIQGIGGAMINASSLAMVVSAFPPEQRGRALGISTAAVYSGISTGPVIGGILVMSLGWRSIFLTVIPLGLTSLILTLTKIKEEQPTSASDSFDFRGSLLYGVSIIFLTVSVSSLGEYQWAWLGLGAGILGMVSFLVLQSRTEHPILNINLLRQNRVFTFSSLAALINYASTFGLTFFMSLYLQYVRGLNARQAGLILVTQPVVQTLLSPLGGRLADRYPASHIATLGMALCGAGLWTASGLGEETTLPMIYAVLIFLGLGFAFFSSPNTSIIMGSVEKRYLGVASGMTGTMRTLGMTISMLTITVTFSALMNHQPVSANTLPLFLKSMQMDLRIFGTLCLLGIGCSMMRMNRSSSDGKL